MWGVSGIRGRSWLSALATLVACSSQEATGPNRAPDPLQTLATLRRFGPVRQQLETGIALERFSAGYRPVPRASAAGFHPSHGRLEATLPTESQGPLRIGLGAEDGLWLELRALDLRPVTAAPVEGALVFADALVDGDVVHVGGESQLEELRLLHRARPSMALRYRWRTGHAVSVLRVRGARVELLDREARVRLQSLEAYAVDARGIRRDASVRLDDDLLVFDFDLRGLVPPILVDPIWKATATPMGTRRYKHRAVVLGDGRVMLVGGKSDPGTVLASVVLYDPVADTFSPGPAMSTTRVSHSLDLLPSGKVLVAGGENNAGTLLSTAEIYDPATGKWTATKGGTMLAARLSHTSTVLASGKVLITGGAGASVTLSAAELFDPATETFSATSSMALPRYAHTATLLPSTSVLIAGGATGPGPSPPTTSTAEVYDPAGGTFAATKGSMAQTRYVHGAILLPSGKVLVIGGFNGGSVGATDLYDPGTGLFAASGDLNTSRDSFALALLPSGNVLAAGGSSSGSLVVSTAEIYMASTGKWALLPKDMSVTRGYLPATRVSTGAVLIAGGFGSNFDASSARSTAELFVGKTTGEKCAAADDCLSGFCADGVCCDADCSGMCSACDIASLVGTCTKVASGPPHGTRTCAPFASCQAGACLTACTSHDDCDAAHFCRAKRCENLLPQGGTCGSARECITGFCVATICCDRACEGGTCVGGTCVPPDAGTPDSAIDTGAEPPSSSASPSEGSLYGCATRSRTGSTACWSIVLLAFLVRARRRTSSATTERPR